MTFALHPQLEADTLPVCELPLCRLLLMNNAHFPWLILVPRRPNLRELHELEPHDYDELMQEIRLVSKTFSAYTNAHKMNIAALGNMVSQLHIHIVARFEKDAAWPAPVWGAPLAPKAYAEDAAQQLIHRMSNITNL